MHLIIVGFGEGRMYIGVPFPFCILGKSVQFACYDNFLIALDLLKLLADCGVLRHGASVGQQQFLFFGV